VLVANGRISGVIDWGDVRRGNPGMDLNVAWALVPASEREAFWDATGTDTPELRRWAWFYALNYGIVLTGYGRLARRPAIVRLGEQALDATVPEARC
jgi:aminoglycoside phosphotransferase (APT) family kinase protein